LRRRLSTLRPDTSRDWSAHNSLHVGTRVARG
jgi:hypothetical protein